jgi:hypothetical protein
MNPIKGTWTNGQILPDEPVVWPEGTELFIEPALPGIGPIGLTEAQWRDNPQAIADWEVWLHTLEPRELTSEEEVALASYEDRHRRFNLDAVRSQMEARESS